MFLLTINEDSNSFIVYEQSENSEPIAHGFFSHYQYEKTILAKIISIVVPSEEAQQWLYNLVEHISDFLTEKYSACLFLRLPSTCDRYVDMALLNFNTKWPSLMAAHCQNLTSMNDDAVSYDHERYELVTENTVIHQRIEELWKIMVEVAFWVKQLTVEQLIGRVNASKKTVIVLDRQTQEVCGLGRLIILEDSHKKSNSSLGYLGDICVPMKYQGRGLGQAIVNTLVTEYLRSINNDSSMCLICADQGSGAVPAPKLYRRFGLEYVEKLKNDIAIFFFPNEKQ